MLLQRWMVTFILCACLVTAHADFTAGGDAYKRGDYKTAAAEFLPLAEKGDHRAMYALGSMYSAGHGVPQDFAMAMKWFKAAVNYGRPDAEYKLGLMYLEGIGTAPDSRKAVNLIGKSAQQGYTDALYLLGMMYFEGIGVQKNNVQAVSWLNLAAEKGHVDAAPLLATITPTITADQLQQAKKLSESHKTKFNKQLQ